MLEMSSRKPPPAIQQVNFRLPHAVWEWLGAAAAVLGKTQAEVVADALQRYRASLPALEQRLIDQTMIVRRKP